MASTVADTTTQTGLDFFNGETGGTVADLTTAAQKCEIDTTVGGAIAHQVGSTFTANQDVNRLTDMVCAKICPANSATVACNGGNNYEVETLTDCGGQCLDTAVCTCDHWTGVVTYTCETATNALLGYTERPVLVDGFYVCEAYDCGTTCSNTDTSTDPTTEIDVANAGCYGDGQPGSSGTCRCDTTGSVTTNTNLGYTAGQFLDTSDTNPMCQQCSSDLE